MSFLVENLASLEEATQALAELGFQGTSEQSFSKHSPAFSKHSPGKIPIVVTLADTKSWVTSQVYMNSAPQHWNKLQTKASEQGFELTHQHLAKENTPLQINDAEELYQLLGLQFIPTEYRDDFLEFNDNTTFSKLEIRDLCGTFHFHTNFSDGEDSLLAMALSAKDVGLSYVGVSDHSSSHTDGNGMSVEQLLEQKALVEDLNDKIAPFKIFHGVESNILADGRLDYPDEILAQLDFVIASVHSDYELSSEAMTKRIIAAISNPYTTILGHPLGRTLPDGPRCVFDHSRVAKALSKHNVAVEINCHPLRHDLDFELIPLYAELGCTFSIGTDARSCSSWKYLFSGVSIARKGYLQVSQLINTLSLFEMEQYLAEVKEGR